jgi:hypothetical protein
MWCSRGWRSARSSYATRAMGEPFAPVERLRRRVYVRNGRYGRRSNRGLDLRGWSAHRRLHAQLRNDARHVPPVREGGTVVRPLFARLHRDVGHVVADVHAGRLGSSGRRRLLSRRLFSFRAETDSRVSSPSSSAASGRVRTRFACSICATSNGVASRTSRATDTICRTACRSPKRGSRAKGWSVTTSSRSPSRRLHASTRFVFATSRPNAS